ncbi:Ribosome-releasing factor 2, mitochondrial [Coemansia thaxteri]|uniref:Elongation factor 2 n=1 Tax=Coemansia thaxteri TaxID=2663907 RepID=A0A9W8BMP0_9FUNG|nr:Ribosome-releasing factor 2, mitochondrial [Coemansia thaxteri]KAJ2007194.1 Ribosome-releasing factor 2, mitochondrial [Coemansia thaxteri]
MLLRLRFVAGHSRARETLRAYRRQHRLAGSWIAAQQRAFSISARRFAVADADPLSRVRNIGIIAHIDAGKTTTTERMLHYAGFTRTIGDVDDGDTIMDYLPAERERGITIQSAAITFGWRGYQLNLIDTPGHVDFTVEVERAMRVLDGAVTIVDAVSGVQAQTKTVWAQAARYHIPRIVFVNKMDRDGANWRKSIRDIETKLSARPLVLMIPEHDGEAGGRLEGTALECWLDVVAMERVSFDISADNTGATVLREPLVRGQHAAYVAATDARVQLVEALAEIDQQIVDVFLSEAVDGDHLRVPASELSSAIRRVTLSSLASPVLLGASFRNIGVQPLLDAIVDYLPAPTDRPPALALSPSGDFPAQLSKTGSGGNRSEPLPAQLGPNEKLVAFAFKVIVDQQRGPMVFVRVYSGTLDSRMTLVNGTRGGIKERATKLLQMYADTPEEIASIECGHIGVVLGLKQTKTGDTLLHTQHPSLNKSSKSNSKKQGKVVAGASSTPEVPTIGLQLHGIDVPPPVFFCAVEADSPQDMRPLNEALDSLTLEDPSLHITYDEETGQTLLSGMGELHLEVVRDRIVKDMKVNASFGQMRVSYREMAGQTASAEFVYNKEVASKTAKAALRVTVSPIVDHDSRADNNDVDVDVSELIGVEEQASERESAMTLRKAVQAAIIEGIRSALFRGTVLGFPVTHTSIRVSDVHYFGEDMSTPAAYRACTSQAFFQAFRLSDPVLLEPIAKTTILCPESHIGSVLSDLNGVRKGRVISLDDSEAECLDSTNATKVLVAEVPLSTMVGYSSLLRSLSAGSASFTMEVVGFGPMTSQQQQQILKESRGYY